MKEEQLGKNIKFLRKRAGLTLEELAKHIGTSKSYIWEIENDKLKPSVFKAYKLARALGVSVEDLVEKEFE